MTRLVTLIVLLTGGFAAAGKGELDDAVVMMERGEKLMAQQKYQEAIAVFVAARALAPGKPGPLLWLGLAYSAADKCAEALPVLEEYVKLQKDNAKPEATRALAACRAVVASKQAAAAEPAKCVLEDAQEAYSRGQYAQAIALARPCIASVPQKAWRTIGASKCFLRDADGAREAFGMLNPPGQNFVRQVCGRQGINLSGSDPMQQMAAIMVGDWIEEGRRFAGWAGPGSAEAPFQGSTRCTSDGETIACQGHTSLRGPQPRTIRTTGSVRWDAAASAYRMAFGEIGKMFVFLATLEGNRVVANHVSEDGTLRVRFTWDLSDPELGVSRTETSFKNAPFVPYEQSTLRRRPSAR